MKVLVDKEHLFVLYKMDNEAALRKLCELECPHLATSILYADKAADYQQFTDYELKCLIKNSNGPDVRSVYIREALISILHAMIVSIPVKVVNAFELDMQLRSLAPGDKFRYLYVPGSMKPKPAEGLAELSALQYTASTLPSPATAVQHAPAPVAPVAPVSSPAAFAVRPANDDFTMPKVGTSTHTIFMFCHKLWEETGFKDCKTTLDNIRKTAVEKLVPTGLNISTVRTQASRWYQHRERLVH